MTISSVQDRITHLRKTSEVAATFVKTAMEPLSYPTIEHAKEHLFMLMNALQKRGVVNCSGKRTSFDVANDVAVYGEDGAFVISYEFDVGYRLTSREYISVAVDGKVAPL